MIPRLLVLVLALPCAAAPVAEPTLTPRPKALRVEEGLLALSAATWSYSGQTTPCSQYALEVLARALGEGAGEVEEAFVRVSPAQSADELASLASELGLPPAAADRWREAFVLDCGVGEPEHIRLVGGEVGLIYGAYTLQQLLAQGPDGPPRVAISDWPSLLTRAWTGVPRDPDSPSFSARLDWFSRWRLNACYYEIYGDQGQDAAPPEVAKIRQECARRGIALYGQISNWRTDLLLERELCAANPEDLARIRRYSEELLDRGCDGLIFLFDDLPQQAVEHPQTCPLCRERFGNLAAAQLELMRPMIEVARERGIQRLIVCPTPYYAGWQDSYQGKLDGEEYYRVWSGAPLMEGVQVYHCLLREQDLADVQQAGLRNYIYWYNGNREYEACTPGRQKVQDFWGGLTELAFGWYGYRWDLERGPVALPDTYDAFRRLPALTQHAWLCGGGDYPFALWGAYCWDAERFEPQQAQRDLLRAIYGAAAERDYSAWLAISRKWYPRLLAPPAGLSDEAREQYLAQMRTDAETAREAAESFAAGRDPAAAEDIGPRMLATARTLSQTAENAASSICSVHLADWTERSVAGGVQRERRMELSDFWSRYSLRYSQTTDEDGTRHRSQWHFGSGLGMTGPGLRNWYDAGFVDVLLDGRSLDGVTPEFSTVALPTGEALLATWNTPQGALRVTFTLFEGGLRLSGEFAGEARLAVRLFAIPGAGQGSWEDMDKYVVTAAGETAHGTPVTLRPGDNWLFLADRTYDVPHEHAEGPCAVLFATAPEQVRCDNGSYVVQIDAEYPVETGQFDLIVWDLHGRTNAEALEDLPALLERASEVR